MKIFVINRVQDEGRLESVLAEFERNCIDAEIVRPEIVDRSIELKETEGWNHNALSLRNTTIKILERAIEENYESVLIFEDDAFINDRIYQKFKSDLKKFKQKVNFWHFLNLNFGKGIKYDAKEIHGFYKTIDGVDCCQAYVISNRIFKTYKMFLEANMLPIDTITAYIHSKFGASYVYAERPVYHKQGQYSTLRDKIVDY